MKRQGPPQLDLFAEPQPARVKASSGGRQCGKTDAQDRAILVRRLKQAQRGLVNGMTPEQFRRCYPRDLPKVTVPRD